MTPLSGIAAILALATISEALIEYLGTALPSQIKPYVAAALGVLLCLAYQADLLALLGLTARVPLVGSVLTGLLVGRGSNFVNAIWERLTSLRVALVARASDLTPPPAP